MFVALDRTSATTLGAQLKVNREFFPRKKVEAEPSLTEKGIPLILLNRVNFLGYVGVVICFARTRYFLGVAHLEINRTGTFKTNPVRNGDHKKQGSPKRGPERPGFSPPTPSP